MIASASPREITSEYCRRHPLVLAHSNTDEESSSNNIMPKTTTTTPLRDDEDQNIQIAVVFENYDDTDLSTAICCDKQLRVSTPSVVSESDSDTHPVFRRRLDLDDDEDDDEEDMFVLKRANPVYESDDENEDDYENIFRPPQKRRRTGGEPSSILLSWSNQIDEDEIDGFTLCSSSSSLLFRS